MAQKRTNYQKPHKINSALSNLIKEKHLKDKIDNARLMSFKIGILIVKVMYSIILLEKKIPKNNILDINTVVTKISHNNKLLDIKSIDEVLNILKEEGYEINKDELIEVMPSVEGYLDNE